MRLLIIDDQVEFRDTYLLRIFGHKLPMDKIEVLKASSIEEGLELLSTPECVILIDFHLGKPLEKDGTTFRNGIDLIRHRRKMESAGTVPVAHIISNCPTHVANAEMKNAGANHTSHRLNVLDLAAYLGSLLAGYQQLKKEIKVEA